MRNLQVRSVDRVVTEEKNVEIDEPGTFGKRFFATHLQFNSAKQGEQLRGGQIGLRFENGIEEPRLVEIVDGFSFVDAGDFCDVDARFAQKTKGLAQILLTGAEVCAERQVNKGHNACLFYAQAPASESNYGVGFRKLHGQRNGQKYDAVESEDWDGENDGSP